MHCGELSGFGWSLELIQKKLMQAYLIKLFIIHLSHYKKKINQKSFNYIQKLIPVQEFVVKFAFHDLKSLSKKTGVKKPFHSKFKLFYCKNLYFYQ